MTSLILPYANTDMMNLFLEEVSNDFKEYFVIILVDGAGWHRSYDLKIPGYIADAIVGHGDKKKSLQALYLNISDQQLLDAVDMMKFDKGETDIRVRK